MKRFFIGLLTLSITAAAYAQQPSLQNNNIAERVVWDTQETGKGMLMYVDVPFSDAGKTDYITLVVSKVKGNLRPEFFSFMVPKNANKDKGITICFAKSVTKYGRKELQPDRITNSHLVFESCEQGACKGRVTNGYTFNDQSQRTDVYQNFLSYDYLSVYFTKPDGSQMTVSLPLSSFREQYGRL
ncbi:hypothetical protein [Taibaiella soli]|uniref:Uncharacterized protein n=1 Tax=Taibaiella soli TaxID=1649169 RepID=A0A2W2BC59_9BACT|nr:hypothetical protein [Taibaiella soli]PZF73477.1 hypothetical protein DN068_08045 [Taibaiella soli]